MISNSSRTPEVLAVGGGKGGVGKSVIAANLAVAVSRRDLRVVLIDGDLGGANLHTLLGILEPRRSLSDFFSRRVSSLEEVRIATSEPNLELISGAQAHLEMANPAYAQKEKLLRHIRALEADLVVIDIGAGSSFNTLDLFLAAQQSMLVVVPDPTSIENAYHFLKAAFFRLLKQAEPKERVRGVIATVTDDLSRSGIRSPRDLIIRAGEEDAEVGLILTRQAGAFHPGVVVNRVRLPDHRRLGEDICLACREYFGVEVRDLGCIDEDPLVGQSVVRRRPVLALTPGSPFARSLESLADLLVDRTQGGRRVG